MRNTSQLFEIRQIFHIMQHITRKVHGFIINVKLKYIDIYVYI